LAFPSAGYKAMLSETNADGLLDESKVRKRFADWIHVFDLIVDVLSNRLHKLASTTDGEFGHKLARIALSVSAQLIAQTLRYSVKMDDCDPNAFCKNLGAHNVKIRNLLEGPLQLTSKQLSKKNSLTESVTVQESCKILFNHREQTQQYEQFVYGTNVSPVFDWNALNRYGCEQLLKQIQQQNFAVAQDIAGRFALPRAVIFPYILLHSLQIDVQHSLCKLYGYDNVSLKQIATIDPKFERLSWILPLLTKHVDFRRKFSAKFNVSLHAIQKSDDEPWRLLLASKQIQLNSSLTDDQLKLHTRLACITNDVKFTMTLIEEWIRRSTDGSLPSACFDLLQCLPEVSRQTVYSRLSDHNIYAPDQRRVSTMFRLKYLSVRNRQNVQLIGNDLEPDSFSTKFSLDLIKHMCDEGLHEILHWYLRLSPRHVREFQQMTSIDKHVQNLHISLLEYDFDFANRGQVLQMLIKTTAYLQSQSDSSKLITDVHDLLTQNRPVETFVSWFLMNDLQSSSSNLNMKQFVHYNCASFPIMTRSFELPDSDSSYAKRCNRLPNLYEMMQHALMFDIGRMFTWQRNNVLATRTEVHRRIPHFGRCELSALYGLRAQLSYLYFLTRGRPQEAYIEFRRSIEGETEQVQQKRTQSATRKTISFALQNSHYGSIALACVQLLRLLRADISNLLFHLKVGNLIAAHAIEYLGLESSQQFRQLGKLLNRLHQQKDRAVATRTFELMQIALERRHRSNASSYSFPSNSSRSRISVHDLKEPSESQLLIKQLFEQKLLVHFARLHSLPPPLEFVRKCIRVNHWLLVAVYAQLYDLSPNVLLNLLEQHQIRFVDFELILTYKYLI
jgi:hypothetical protein